MGVGHETQLRVPGWKRVADRLADGRWHTSYELTHELQVMTHSRLAELRGKGYLIEKRTVPGAEGLRAFEYRLVEAPCEADDDRGSADPSTSSASQGAPAPCGTDGPPDLGAPESLQLDLDSALTGAAVST